MKRKPHPLQFPVEPTAAEQAAMEWVCRVDRGLTAAQADEFSAWRAADPEHERLLAEYEGTWALLGECAPSAPGAPGRLARGKFSRWRRFAPLVAAAAVAVIAYVGWWRPNHFSATPMTAIGGLETLALPDGSILTLNTDTAVAVNFSPTERRVRLLRGQLHADVAKQPARPFFVDASGVSVRAVGTAFDVRLDHAVVEVLVSEGTVAVARGPGRGAASATTAAALLVSAGNRAVMAVESAAVPPAMAAVDPIEIRRRQAWRLRRLEFAAAPLSEIVAEFNRYNRHRLEIADPKLAHDRFGGAFQADDYEALVRMLQENFGVTAEIRETSTVLRYSAEAPAT